MLKQIKVHLERSRPRSRNGQVVVLRLVRLRILDIILIVCSFHHARDEDCKLTDGLIDAALQQQGRDASSSFLRQDRHAGTDPPRVRADNSAFSFLWTFEFAPCSCWIVGLQDTLSGCYRGVVNAVGRR